MNIDRKYPGIRTKRKTPPIIGKFKKGSWPEIVVRSTHIVYTSETFLEKSDKFPHWIYLNEMVGRTTFAFHPQNGHFLI